MSTSESGMLGKSTMSADHDSVWSLMTDVYQNKEAAEAQKLEGSCLCGSVRFELHGQLRDIISCYCSECRKSSGNFVNATALDESGLHLLKEEGLRWYENGLAQRGFCQYCGSSLFWKSNPANGQVSVMAGCLQIQTGLQVRAHIFTQDKNDFHQISGAAPQYRQGECQTGITDRNDIP